MGESALTTVKTVPEDSAELYAQQKSAQEELQQANRDLSGRELVLAHDTWVRDYGHLFFWCCGSPVFGGESAESYFIEGKWERGLPQGGTAVLHGL